MNEALIEVAYTSTNFNNSDFKEALVEVVSYANNRDFINSITEVSAYKNTIQLQNAIIEVVHYDNPVIVPEVQTFTVSLNISKTFRATV